MLCGFRHLLYQKSEKKGNANEKKDRQIKVFYLM